MCAKCARRVYVGHSADDTRTTAKPHQTASRFALGPRLAGTYHVRCCARDTIQRWKCCVIACKLALLIFCAVMVVVLLMPMYTHQTFPVPNLGKRVVHGPRALTCSYEAGKSRWTRSVQSGYALMVRRRRTRYRRVVWRWWWWLVRLPFCLSGSRCGMNAHSHIREWACVCVSSPLASWLMSPHIHVVCEAYSLAHISESVLYI